MWEKIEQYKPKIKTRYNQNKFFWDSNLIEFDDFYQEFLIWCFKHQYDETKAKFTTYFHNQLFYFESNYKKKIMNKCKKRKQFQDNKWIEFIDFEKLNHKI